MHIQSLHLPSINFPLTTTHPLFPSSPSSSSSYRLPTSLPVRTQRTRSRALWIAQASEFSTATTTTAPPAEEEGPIELPPSTPSVFATDDDPSPLQITTSVLLTGAIAVFLFRSLRRRAKRAKEMRFRSTGVKKSLKEEAMDSLKALTPVEEGSPPSPIQALLGGLTAGIIALVLYKFTLTIEAGLNRQNISDDFSVRQITITVRTIINGICYLATFVFGINAIGLILYSGQLAINSLMEGGSTDKVSSGNDDGQLSSTASSTNSSVDNKSSNSNDKDQLSDEAQ